MRLTDYKNIIFDLGGVILNLDYQLTISAFEKLGSGDVEVKYSQLQQVNLFDEYERGEMSSSSFRQGIRESFGLSLPDEEIDKAWNAMLLDLPIERLQLLSDLRKTKNLVLLSNTNAIHINSFSGYLKEHHATEDLSGYFDKLYYSFEMGMRKPEPRIFQFVLDEQNYNPRETLFIDDSPQHIEAAQTLGVNTYHIRADKGETILDLF
ncbi:HAD family phosphatase [Flavobacteriales bacterium]|nr:HAD family phosphatase [Flavobacteriales bacterium]